MDDQRFEGLVRAFGHGTSRRGTLGLLGRSVAGVASVVLLTAKPAAAGQANPPTNPGNSKPGHGKLGNGPNGQPGDGGPNVQEDFAYHPWFDHGR